MPSLWAGKVQEIFKISLIIFTFFYIFILFVYSYSTAISQKIFFVNKSIINKGTINEQSNIPIYDKFIAADYKYCNGLGNQLYHISTYYGIGRSLNRTPFLYLTKPCETKFLTEIKAVFPNLFKFLPLLNPIKNETKSVKNLNDCCNVESLKTFNETYLIFDDFVPHFYQFFHKFKSDIQYLMEFDADLKEDVQHKSKKLFWKDKSHKFCIHIRRGDFLNEAIKFQESKAEFIVPASTYIYNYLNKTLKSKTNVSLILMGEDETFKNSLKINEKLFEHIYFQYSKNRGQDLAFGVLNCDTFLLSASGSTFAWWIGYLLPDEKNVFYNGKIYKDENDSKFPFSKVFPSNWNKINIV